MIMKKVLNLLILGCFLVGITTLNSCKKDKDMPTLTTTAVTAITTTGATSGGNITDDGGAEVTDRGICWGTATNPTTSGSKVSSGVGSGSFSADLTGLTPNTLYYVRAFATNSEGTAYGNEVSFTTAQVVGATVTTAAVTAIAQTTATAGGNVTADGGADITERGVYFGTTSNPSSGGTKVAAAAAGTGAFTVNLTGLTPGTLYYVMAFATNSSGTSYGTAVQFTALAAAPAVTTAQATSVTQSSAVAGGSVTSTGGAAITERGVYFGTGNDPATTGTKVTATLGDVGSFTVNLTTLTAGTRYYFVAFATNSAGTSFGTVLDFTTTDVVLGTVTTTAPALIATSSTSVTAGGNVTSAGGGTISERGVCYAITPNPDIDDDTEASATSTTGTFQVTLEGLLEGTVYYVRAYVINEEGPAYGTQAQILTMVSDVEDNIYNTVLIGDQVWMAENLNTRRYNDDTAIPNITGNANWAAATSAGYSYYMDNVTYGATYGALYNFWAINTGRLCPTGWRVASDNDFKTLEMELGMTQGQADGVYERGTDQGVQMKTPTGWNPGGIAGTNSSGFSAVPGGYRFYETGLSTAMGAVASFGTSTSHSATSYIYRQLWYNTATVYRVDVPYAAGFSVRCVKVN